MRFRIHRPRNWVVLLLPCLLAWVGGLGCYAGEIPWAFEPVQSPPFPNLQNSDWPRDDLDRFIAYRLEREGLEPSPDASRAQLLRRACLDLTGLPPTEEQILTFTRDPAPLDDAWPALVDELLASPRFGERWARHWLDIVRYADSVGHIWNAPFVYAWKYRDYVIDALNSDIPYDRFIAEQLAGDLLPASSDTERQRQQTATGLLALGSLDLQQGSEEAFLMDRIDDQIDVVGRGFLGLTLACARCHDHKYDSITQADYYALAGIFYSSETLSGQRQRGGGGIYGYVDVSQALPLSGPSASRGRLGTQASATMAPRGMQMDMVADDGQTTYVWSGLPNAVMGVREGVARHCPIRRDGEAHQFGPLVVRGRMQIPGLPRLPAIPPTSSGRLELARWIGSRQNPLTARVCVNRVWHHLLGHPLVETLDDFGNLAPVPTHPDLLDHLAVSFMEDGWSVKRLIRRILLSRTYRQDSRASAGNPDPDNLFYSRHSLRRLDWEPLRDSIGFLSGRLIQGRPDGVSVAGMGGKGKYGRTRPLLDLSSGYRTIYLPVIRAMVPESYSTFDFPDPSQMAAGRTTTTTAPQALFFMNDAWVYQCATQIASAALDPRFARQDPDRIRRVMLRCLGRPARDEEIGAALAFLRGWPREGDPSVQRLEAWSAWVQALLASSEFRYVW